MFRRKERKVVGRFTNRADNVKDRWFNKGKKIAGFGWEDSAAFLQFDQPKAESPSHRDFPNNTLELNTTAKARRLLRKATERDKIQWAAIEGQDAGQSPAIIRGPPVQGSLLSILRTRGQQPSSQGRKHRVPPNKDLPDAKTLRFNDPNDAPYTSLPFTPERQCQPKSRILRHRNVPHTTLFQPPLSVAQPTLMGGACAASGKAPVAVAQVWHGCSRQGIEIY
uniref:Uncharacterized protein n=1 Tax=Eutreptiella gymnastica TaxID=73025 RepID=A0A7S1I1J8_9EUGL|mmetsp:Transcript_12225/g.22173  ORF Transcript_12225/g.22173 Transcript_12225/m.22173 type:complete len:223 (+) Transcript_12225:199-867(+)